MAKRRSSSQGSKLTYKASGVDISANDRMVDKIKQSMQRTYSPRVIARHGSFAGLMSLDFSERLLKRRYRDPILVSGADGVGSKLLLGLECGRVEQLGIDLVAMSVNDILTTGAEPLFFLDYIGIHKVDPAIGERIVKGVADGCELADCALLGGETAELPSLYAPGDFDLAGFAVGVCELRRVLDSTRVETGDVILGLASSGVHSNGFGLVRAIIDEAALDLNHVYAELDPQRTLGQVLLTPTRIYVRSIVTVLRRYKVKQVISAMSHITGGGLPGNLPRTLGPDQNARIQRKSWTPPAVFGFLQRHGSVEDDEMLRVFNMGIGYVVVVRPHFAQSVAHQLRRLGEQVCVLGKVVKGTGQMVLI